MNLGVVNPSCPVNLSHPLNRGLVSWWKVLPNFRGGKQIRDLCQHRLTTQMDFNIGGDSVTGKWSGVTHPGGFGAWDLDSNDLVDAASGGYDHGSDGNFTVTCWYNPHSAGTRSDILQIWSTGQHKWILLETFSGSGKPQFFISTDGNNYPSSGVGSKALSNGTWDWIAGSYDGATIKVFMNGDLEASNAEAGGSFSSTEVIHFGRAGTYAHGYLDDVRVYDRALSDDETRRLFLLSCQKYTPLLNWMSGSGCRAQNIGPWPWHLDRSLSGNFASLGM